MTAARTLGGSHPLGLPIARPLATANQRGNAPKSGPSASSAGRNVLLTGALT